MNEGGNNNRYRNFLKNYNRTATENNENGTKNFLISYPTLSRGMFNTELRRKDMNPRILNFLMNRHPNFINKNYLSRKLSNYVRSSDFRGKYPYEEKVIKYLINKGASRNYKNKKGNTPFEVAIEKEASKKLLNLLGGGNVINKNENNNTSNNAQLSRLVNAYEKLSPSAKRSFRNMIKNNS